MGTGPDPMLFTWFIHWWPFAVQHHLNPLFTDYVWHPDGLNLAWTTSVPLVAFVMWPVTAAAGPILSFNIATVLAPALAAWTAFLLARYLSRRWLPSLFAGYFFGFSSYELGQMLGHLHLILIFLVPVAVLLCIARLRGDLSRRVFVPALAVVLTAQLGISSEILATLCLMGAMTWAIYLRCAKPEAREPYWRLAWDIALAAPLTVLLASPYLYGVWLGMAHGQPFHTSPGVYSADLLNYFIPTRATLIGGSAHSIATRFTGETAEQGAYLGLPLIAIIAWYFRDHYRNAAGKALLFSMLLIVILSLGPRLHIAEHLTPIRLPWHLLVKVPVVEQALPTRFGMYVALCASMIVALWMAEAKTSRQRIIRLVVASIAVLAIVPNVAIFPWLPWPSQPFFQDPQLAQAPGKRPNVLILPFSNLGAGMAWQLDAGMSFTQATGYLGPDPERGDTAFFKQLRLGEPGPSFGKDLKAYCLSHKVDYILVAPDTATPLVNAITRLPWKQQMDRGIFVVTPPRIADSVL
jgi:hypothetical protein